MQTLEKEQNKLTIFKEELEDLLALDITEEYKKEIRQIIYKCALRVRELVRILNSKNNVVEKALRKNLEYLTKNKLSKKYAATNKIEDLQSILEIIKSTEKIYKDIKNIAQTYDTINYCVSVLLNINNKILNLKNYLETKNKGFYTNKDSRKRQEQIRQLNKHQRLLSNLVYNFISITKRDNKDIIN